MKINRFKKRTRAMPLEGIRLLAAEKRAADMLSRQLADVPDEFLVIMRTALAEEILRLDEAQEWTQGGTETDDQRLSDLEMAVIAYQGVYLAYIRNDTRTEERVARTEADQS